MPERKDRLLNGKTVSQQTLREKVRDYVRTHASPETHGVSIDDIITALGEPPELKTKDGRRDFVLCLDGWKRAGFLASAGHGRYQEGARGRRGWSVAEANEKVALAVLKANGGFISAQRLTRALGLRDDVLNADGALVSFIEHEQRRNFMASIGESKLIRCDFKNQRYHLAPELLNTIVLEGRWIGALRAYGAMVFPTFKAIGDAGGPNRMQDLWLKDLHLRYQLIGNAVHVCRTTSGMQPELMLQDEPFREALSDAVSRYVPFDPRKGGEEARVIPDRRQAMLLLYEEFERGDGFAHQAVRIPFYVALARLLDCEPVAMSRGEIIAQFEPAFEPEPETALDETTLALLGEAIAAPG